MTGTDSARQEDGVPARRSASTPSSVAGVADAETLLTLEWREVLELVASHAAGPLGAARVRARLPGSDGEVVREALAVVGELLALLRHGDDLPLGPVPDLSAIVARLRVPGTVLDGPEFVSVGRTLAVARGLARELRRLATAAPRAAAALVDLPPADLDRRLAGAFDPGTGELLDTASPTLAAARREVQVARGRLLQRLDALLRGLDPQAVPPGAAVTVREGRYVIPVRRDARGRPDGIIHDESGSAGTLFLEPSATVPLGNALRSAQAEADREALRILRDLTDLLRPFASVLAAAQEMCVITDDLLARARWALATGADVPEVVDEGTGLEVRGARHPLLVARGDAVVAFDMVLQAAERTVLVTGPNTGGKTVLLKTIGLLAALAQAGIVPPVRGATRLPLFRRIVADIGDHQSLAHDLSTFSAHVGLLRRVLDAAGPGTLALLDEVGSGTDPVEGAALAAAVLGSLTGQGTLTIATTHLGALKTLPEEVPGIVNGSLHFDTTTLAPTYRFRLGVPGRSYGLAIARRLGLGEEVLAEAERRVPRRERDLERLLGLAEDREREWRLRLDVVVAREAGVSAREAALEDRERSAARREADLRDRERQAERRAREAAREHLLAARAQVEEALRVAGAGEEATTREARRLIEEAARAEASALAALDEPSPAPDAEAGDVRAGDRVRTAAGAIGQVVEKRGDGRLVVRAGAMRLVVDAGQVARLAPEPAGAGRPVSRWAHEAREVLAAPMEIDLRGMRADEAESLALAALDAAVLAEHPQLRIIHGMGTGAVRERVQRVLRADRRVARFAFAAAAQGGTGVTVAELGPR